MGLSKWILGLSAVGAVSLTSAARADEEMGFWPKPLSSTTIMGDISTSMNWAVAPTGDRYQKSPAADIPLQGPSKEDGFNLDVVRLAIVKPGDETPWASGYNVELLFGPDAVGFNPSANSSGTSDFSIKQAYVLLRTPVGNGIDWKIGVFDTIIGYESFDAARDHNYTRSWGWAVEPYKHTGILATYPINDMFVLSAGIANILATGINNRAYDFVNNTPSQEDWNKTYMGSLTFTAPDNWGWASGSFMSGGIVWGFNGTSPAPSNNFGSQNALNAVSGAGQGSFNYYANGNQANYYAGVTLNTPWEQLTLGAAFDYVQNLGGGFETNYVTGNTSTHIDMWVAGLYSRLELTHSLSLNMRGEYYEPTAYGNTSTGSGTHTPVNGLASSSSEQYQNVSGYELTGTIECMLWANVTARLEGRWDVFNEHTMVSPSWVLTSFPYRSSLGLYVNVIYKF